MSRLILFLPLIIPQLFLESAHAIGAEEALKLATRQEVPEQAQVKKTKTTEGEVQDETQELIPVLSGCVITSSAEHGLALQAGASSKVIADGFDEASTHEIEKLISAYLSKPVTLHSLDVMAEQIEHSLESRQQVMMRASFPPQEITGGVVVILVQPAIVGRVSVRGEPSFGLNFIRDNFRARSGQEVTRDSISADLDWMNQNSLRQSRITFVNGKDASEIDLAIQVSALRPWRVYGGVDNSLSERLGDLRWFLGMQQGDLWHLDHRITAQFTAGFDYEALHGASLIYEIPLPWRHLIQFSASLSASSSARNSGNSLVDQSGEFQRYSVMYMVPLRTHGWSHEWRTGVTFRDQVYQLNATGPGGSSINRQRGWHGLQLETGWTAQKQDKLGQTRVNLTLQWNPGWEGASASEADFRSLGATAAHAWIMTADVSRTLTLGHFGMISARLNGQWSDHALLAADQFAPAIFGRVRGFDEITGYGDNGATLNLEWLSRWVQVPKAGAVRAVTFLDSATVQERTTQSDLTLVSTGFGLRWQWHGLNGTCDLGIPLQSPEGVEKTPRLRFSIVARW